MLSRTAEALFWIGRYVERADDTARLLDVQLRLLAQDPWAPEEVVCARLLDVMGVQVPAGEQADRARVLEALGYDAASAPSIVASVTAAREHARSARDAVPAELWEALNTTYGTVPAGRWRAQSPHPFLAWVRERAAAVAGIADSTMSRDDGWLFLALGRSIERADMTARLVAATATRGGAVPPWPSILRACGAQEAFLRSSRGTAGTVGIESHEEAAGFLLLDRLFPRSITHALTRAERCLSRLESTGQRTGVFDEAQRRLGRVRAELEYRPLAEVLAQLPEEMDRIRRTCAAATDAVTRQYFSSSDALTWVGGRA